MSQNRNFGDQDGVVPEDLGQFENQSPMQSGDNLEQLMLISQNSDNFMSTQKQLTDFLNITQTINNGKHKKVCDTKSQNKGQLQQQLLLPKSLENQQKILQQNTKLSKQGMSARNEKIIGSGSGVLVGNRNNHSFKQSARSNSKAKQTYEYDQKISQSSPIKIEVQQSRNSKHERSLSIRNSPNKVEIVKVEQQPNRLSLINSRFLGSDLLSDTQQFEQSFGQEPKVRQIYKRDNASFNAAKIDVNLITSYDRSKTKSVQKEDTINSSNSHPLMQIECVKMTDQYLTTVPDKYLQQSIDHHNIKILDLSSNQIRKISYKVFECLPCLEELNLSKNQIESFEFKNHSKLRIINLSFNQLDNLCDEICSVTSLQELYLQHNLFKSITTSIISLKKLEILDLSYNKLRDLPNGLGYLTKLTQIMLQSNKLRFLPAEFHYLPNITKFGLDWFQYCYPPFPIIMEQQNKRYKAMQNSLNLLSVKNNQSEIMKDQVINFKDFVKNLSSQDSYIQYMDNKNRTKLHIAVLKNDKTILNFLLQTEIDFLNDLDTDNYTPLGLAIKEERLKLAYILLKEEQIQIEIRCGQFNSILMLAIQKLEPTIVEKMLERGADVNLKDISSGDYPIHTLIGVFGKNTNNSRKILELMINYACDLNIKNSEQWSPLHLAVKKSNYETVQALIELSQQGLELDGIDLNLQGGPDRQTALHIAALGSYITNYKIVNLLIQSGADLFVQNIYQKTPFNCVSNNLLMLKLLKKAEMKHINQMFSQSIQVKEYHFKSAEIVNKLFKSKTQKYFQNSLTLQQPRQAVSLNRTSTNNYDIISESQINEANRRLISFQDQINAIGKYLQDPLKQQKIKNFQGQQFISTSSMFKVDFRRNITVEFVNNQKNLDTFQVEEEPPSSQDKKIKHTIINQSKQLNKRPLSPEQPNYQIKNLETPQFRSRQSKNRFSKTTQDLNQMLRNNFSSNQIPNVYFLKDTITDTEIFNKLSSCEQISIFASFQQLFITPIEKQYNLVIDIIQILYQLNNNYLIERILEFIENLQISQQINYKYQFRENLEKVMHKFDKNRLEIKEKIQDILDQYPNNGNFTQRFTISRLSNPNENMEYKLNKELLIQPNQHRDKNPFSSKQQSREKAISFNGINQNQNLIMPSKKQLKHPAITLNMQNSNIINKDSVKSNVAKSFKDKYVISPPQQNKQYQKPGDLQIDLDKTQNMFTFSQMKTNSDKKPPLASKLIFLSPNTTTGFRNYFQEQKEEGNTPKTKLINIQTTKIKHNKQQYIHNHHNTITPMAINSTDDHAKKMLIYHNHQQQKSDVKSPPYKFQKSITSSQQQTRQNSAYKVQKVALSNLFEGPPEDEGIENIDLNFENHNILESYTFSNMNPNRNNNINTNSLIRKSHVRMFEETQKITKFKGLSNKMSDQYRIYSMRKIVDSPPQAPSSHRKVQGNFEIGFKPKIGNTQGQQTKRKS